MNALATKTEAGEVVTLTTTNDIRLPAEAVLAAVCDFSSRRELIFPAVSTRRLTVHALGTTNADATEGTRAGPFVMWERCEYDWSQPGTVTATVTDSNVYAAPESSWTLTATPTDGGCQVVMTWRRQFKRHLLGRVMGQLYRRVGPRAFGSYASDVVANLEAAAA